MNARAAKGKNEEATRIDDAEVLVVGAGPTGLTLAIDLARRGVRAAHQLKGASANISCTALKRVAARIEDLGRERRFEEVAANLAELRRESRRFTEFKEGKSFELLASREG